jgi:hypothetical protein
MRMQVVLPQPEGTDDRDELAILHFEVDVLQRDEVLAALSEGALHGVESDDGHSGISCGLEAAPRFDQLLHAAQRDVDQQADRADRDHSAHHVAVETAAWPLTIR